MARDSRRVAKRANRPNPREERNQTIEPAAFLARSPFGRDGTPENVVPFTRPKKVELLPRNMAQERYIEALSDETKPIVFAMGPAGTGKTLLATKYAIQQMQDGECDRIVITRPAVSVDEQHGFLPGTLIQKCEPWMLPILDVFREHYDPRVIQKMMLENLLEIAPLAYCRGRTFKNCIVIGDEMQNATPSQMKMLLTRIGDNSRMFITGDLRQHDRGYEKNGLKDFVERLSQRRSGSIAVVEFGPSDVERHPVIEEILAIYGED